MSNEAEEKQALRFVRLIQKLQSSGVMKELGLVPLLAGATGDEAYAAQAFDAAKKSADGQDSLWRIRRFLKPFELIPLPKPGRSWKPLGPFTLRRT